MAEVENTYYQILKESGIDAAVITTNYTSLVEHFTGKEVVYLHGKTTWFEDLDNLTIYDCLNPAERKLAEQNVDKLIPFILISSGVKLMICKRKIEEFHKFIEAMDNSETLIIMGYRFNSEDNHINSTIAQWLRESGHRMVYFNFKNGVNFADMEWSKNFERNDIPFDGNNLQLDNATIQNISVNESNVRTAFKCYVDAFKGKSL